MLAFTLLSTPIIARYFTPLYFGPFAGSFCRSTICLGDSSFRFEVASVLPDSPRRRRSSYQPRMVFTVTSSVIAVLGSASGI